MVDIIKILMEISRKILKKGVELFEGTGIGKFPLVFKVYSCLSSVLFRDIAITTDGQRLHISGNVEPRATLDLYYHQGDAIEEPHVSSLFCSLIKKGMTVVDVGAFIGYYTLLAAKRVGSEGKVFAFEPYPPSFSLLLKNIQVNKWRNIQASQLAVSDSEGERKLNIPYGPSNSSFGALPNIKDSITIKTVSLDSFLQVTDVDVIKIDVEGAELEVLRGMKKILAEGRPKIICEVHPRKISFLDYSTKEISDFLKEYNYNTYLISEKEPKLIPMTEILNDKRRHYLFTREEMV